MALIPSNEQLKVEVLQRHLPLGYPPTNVVFAPEFKS